MTEGLAAGSVHKGMALFNPFDHPICFSYPLRVASTARERFWMEHFPFAMFLVDVLEPMVFVELGTFSGVSYCAFCQAVKELRIAFPGMRWNCGR